MKRPNWFDQNLGAVCDAGDAGKVLEAIAKDPRVVEAVRNALEPPKAKVMGPSASQRVRDAIAEVLNSEAL